MTNFYYFQVEGGEESWHPVPVSQIQNIRAAKKPMFVTALAVDKLVDKDMEKADVAALKYTGDFYLDWDDASSPESTAPFAVDCIKKMEKMGVNPESLRLYATGGKGFHCLVPSEIFLEKIPKTGITGLPYIFRELALELAVDTLDLRVYTGRMGRMWREANVERPNGKYKVPITWTELQNFSEETYADVCSKPRVEPTREKAEYSLDFAVLFSKCQQKVADKLSARKRIKPATHLTTGALPSFEALCKGKGIKEGIGFHPLAMQISIVANARGMSEDDLVTLCEGLITSHVSDGNRYDTPSKRERELRRMWAYTQDNPMYDPSVGALKSLLNHAAPDLEGLPVARADIEENIEKADNGELDDEDIDEFSDVAGVHLTRFGVYVNTEFGQKRVCAISFDDVVTLKSLDTGTISCIQAQVLVNGKRHGPQALELETFHSLQMFNRFCSRLGHAFQGTDGHVRGTYMRVVEMAKKRGKDVYITSREGLDLVTIPNHEIERLRSPFMIWADGHGVSMEPDVASLGVDIQFHGYPDQRGQFRTDLGDAPSLIHWLKEGTNKEDLKVMLQNMFACQKPQAIGKILGWTTACFYRMLFHKAYSQFPILHINGSAGSGKSSMFKTFMNLFYWQQEPKILSPTSTAFAITYSAAGSTSIPLVVDEYKPHEMLQSMHDKLKLTFRDSYNGREVQRGGGTRDNDDYRALHSSALLAPVAFIAEAVEEESALLERVVLVTISKPPSFQATKSYVHFAAWEQKRHCLSVIGKYLAQQTLHRYSVEQLQEDFGAVYAAARRKYMLNEDDVRGNLEGVSLEEKQQAKERTVFNFSVAQFGLQRFRKIIEGVFEEEFEELFGNSFREAEAGVFERMTDLYQNTQPEWLKVFNSFSEMSFSDDNAPWKLREGTDYAFVQYQGRECVELYVRQSYSRYRMYCRSQSVKPLYQSEGPFLHGLRDCPAVAGQNIVLSLAVPGGSHIFSLAELNRLGFRGFKN